MCRVSMPLSTSDLLSSQESNVDSAIESPKVAEQAGAKPASTQCLAQFVSPAGFLAWFTCAYFASVLLLAHEKLFDYDELITLYISRLPVSRMIHELAAGIEPHPPLQYSMV